jgi:hypothetical protein
MFQCHHTPLVEIRQAFLTKAEVELPCVAGQFPDVLGLFRGLLPKREITSILAKMAYDVFKVFDSTPMLLVSGSEVQHQSV